MKNVAQAYHGVNGFVLCHASKKGIPILGLFAHMMNSLGYICQRAINIEDDKLICHRSLLKISLLNY